MAPAIKLDVNSYCLPLPITQALLSRAARPPRADDEGHSRVSSLWPDKSRAERCVVRAAEAASASGERGQEWKMEIEHMHFKRGRQGFNQSCAQRSIEIK